MGKGKKKASPSPNAKSPKKGVGNLLRKPKGMSSVLFKDIAWLLAQEAKQKP